MYIADLHIHSKYSRATSRDCDLPHLDAGMRKKGVQLLGTGDFTHPAWRAEMAASLEKAEDGLYRLRTEMLLPDAWQNVPAPRFVISGEISTIYKKDGKTRKVHHLILLPSLEAAEELSRRLELIGNIHSDGRPILGLDSRDLMRITYDACPEAIFIPAHIWTPHFSLFGAFSDFSTIEECYGDMTPYIHALETGLSSDPPMNRQLSALDSFQLVSNSDAHSPAKLAREANIMDCGMSYSALRQALHTGNGLAGTIEFFPEEGKYHLDGHRNCKCRLEPHETNALDGRCPICGRKVTVGVQHRVDDLSDRSQPEKTALRHFEYLMPLEELLADCMGATPASKKVQAAYADALKNLGSELHILRKASLDDIKTACGELTAEAMRRLRAGEVIREAGYDGEYGKIALFRPGEREIFSGQTTFMDLAAPAKKKRAAKTDIIKSTENSAIDSGANPEQAEAITAADRAVAVIAGPGTGKTYTLVERAAYMITEMGVKPSEITAVTFTNQAAAELKARLEKKLGKKAIRGINVGTFHSICLSLIPKTPIAGHTQALGIISQLLSERGDRISPTECLKRISAVRNGAEAGKLPEGIIDAYRARLSESNLRDLDDILDEALEIDVSGAEMFKNLLVDEYQDINATQRRLVAHWLSGGGTLFAIGDPDQSIYGFRGASSGCFDELKALIPELRTITLVRNYRSAPEIIAAALSVIGNNPGMARSLAAARPSGRRVRMLTCPDALTEGHMIAREINRMTGGIDMLSASGMEETRAFSDIAVICRTRRQLARIETELAREGIPCAIVGRDDSLAEESTQSALAFFRWLTDSSDAASRENALKLFKNEDELDSAAELFGPRLSKDKPRKLITDLGKLTGREFTALADAALFVKTMPALIEVLETGEEADLKRLSGNYSSGAVTLMTMHAAKGLEFPAVFLAGVTNGEFPSENASDIREERRLFFVGITRARDELIISTSGAASRFVSELPDDILRENVKPHRITPEYEQLSFL